MSLGLLRPLVTRRLSIRDADERDAMVLVAVHGDPEVARYLPHGPWPGAAEAPAWLGRMRALESAGRGRLFVLALRETDEAIGTVLFFGHEAGSQRAELAYALGRAHWGRGLMQEALRPCCAAAFDRAGLCRIEALVRPENRASNRLLSALGFTLEGRLRQRWRRDGHAHDVLQWGLLAGELR